MTVAASWSASGVVWVVELTRGSPGGALAYSLKTTPSASRPRSRPPMSMTAIATRSSTLIRTASGHLRDTSTVRMAATERSRFAIASMSSRASCSPSGTLAWARICARVSDVSPSTSTRLTVSTVEK